MLNNEIFVRQSLIDHLFFLRTLKEYCVNIQLSFWQNEQDYMTTAESFGARATELLKEALRLSKGTIFTTALGSGVFVTEYTLSLERLTESLFDISLATEITIEQIRNNVNTSLSITDEIRKNVQEINQDALIFATNFLDFLKEIYQRQIENELFSYSYPDLFLYMMDDVGLYLSDLERLINDTGVDPIFVINYKYDFSSSLRTACSFIIGYSNPTQTEVMDQARFFQDEFGKLMAQFLVSNLNPTQQENIRSRAIQTGEDFKTFLRNLIQDILDKNLFFIVEPIFFDNILTDVNYFLYLLKGSELGQGKNTSEV